MVPGIRHYGSNETVQDSDMGKRWFSEEIREASVKRDVAYRKAIYEDKSELLALQMREKYDS